MTDYLIYNKETDSCGMSLTVSYFTRSRDRALTRSTSGGRGTCSCCYPSPCVRRERRNQSVEVIRCVICQILRNHHLMYLSVALNKAVPSPDGRERQALCSVNLLKRVSGWEVSAMSFGEESRSVGPSVGEKRERVC